MVSVFFVRSGGYFCRIGCTHRKNDVAALMMNEE